MKLYDVFISYRRKDGQNIAENLYKYLRGKGLRVFFDLEKMEKGSYFPSQLEYGIRCAPHYILIATPEVFSFTENTEPGKKDYVLEEMRLACSEQKANPTERTFHVINTPELEYIEAHKLSEDIRGVSFPTWQTLRYGVDNKDIFETVFKEITTVNRMNMWYGASRWYEESRSRGGRFERLDICDAILPKASAKTDRYVELPVNVRIKTGDTEKTLPLFDALKESTGHLYLVGQGGIGKTTSLMKIMQDSYDNKQYSENIQIPLFVELSFAPDMYGALYENGKSSFIRRSVFRQIRKDNTLHTVNKKQIRAVDEVFTLPNDVAVDPVTDILSKTSPAPEYLLLLDGLNEVSTAEIEETGRSVRHMIISEIELLVNECPNVRVLLTSRSDENVLNNDNLQKFCLSETDEESIKKYLADNGKTEVEIEDAVSDENLKKALGIPLFLSMYARLSETEGISSQGEIMRVFFSEKKKDSEAYTAQDRLEQVERDIIENSEGRNEKRITSQMQNFFLDFVVPEIAWHMERNNEFYFDEEDIENIIYPIFEPIYENERFPKYHICGKYGRKCFDKYDSDSAFSGTDEAAEEITKLERNFRRVTKRILDCCNLSLGILQKTNDKYGFIHHHIRDYFAAVKNINSIRIAVCINEAGDKELARDCLGYMRDMPFSMSVCRFIGESLHELLNRPTTDNDGITHYNVPDEPCDRNILKRALDIFRGRFDGTDGYCVYNLINSISEGRRRELCGENLSRLDFRHCSLSHIMIGNLGCGANLNSALLNKNNIFPTGHTGDVNSVSYSPDGKYIVSADKTIKIWDSRSYGLIKTLEGHTDWVNSVSYSPDGKCIISVSDDKTIKIWDSRSYELIKTLEGHTDWVNSVSYSPDGKYVVSASSDETIKIWDSRSYELHKTLEGHTDWVNSVSYSPDGKCIVSVSDDKIIKIWDSRSYKLLKTLEGHINWVNGVSYSPDGECIVSASNDRTIKIWDSHSYELIKTLEGHTDWVNSVAYSPDGKCIVGASSDQTIKIWDSRSYKLIKTFTGWVNSVAYSPDGKRIVGASHDKTIKIWNSRSYELFKTLEGHTAWVNSVVCSPDGKYIVSASSDGTIKVWNAETYECVKTIPNIPGLFVIGCDMTSLHPDSDLSEEDRKILKLYGAKIETDN